MKKLTILGLCAHYPHHLRTRKDFGDGDLWVMNDFYQFYPALRLRAGDKMFQIHEDFKGHLNDPWRFQGNWIERYNAHEAEAVTVQKYPGLTRQLVVTPAWLLSRHPPGYYSSTIVIMLELALSMEYTHIHLDGFSMMAAGEYENQLPGLVLAVENVRAAGVTVSAAGDLESKWMARLVSMKVDWHKIPDQLPYWLRGIPEEILKVKLDSLVADGTVTLSFKDLARW